MAKQISTKCINTVHNECDGRVKRGGSTVARCECECHQEGVMVGAVSVPLMSLPMKEAIEQHETPKSSKFLKKATPSLK